MPFEIRDDVYIKKLDDPLILEQYEQVFPISISQGKVLKKPRKYLMAYQKYRDGFLKLHEVLRLRLINKMSVSQALWDEYQEAKENLLTAQGIINQDYDRKSVEANKS